MRVLVIDTATRRAWVAAVRDGQTLAERCHETPLTHAERLFGMLEEVLQEASWALSDVDLIVVGRGPGSFTGVRVGMAAAKGLALTLGKPLVGVVSLHAMAWSAAKHRPGTCLVPLLDAKKGELFLAVYDEDGKCLVEPSHLGKTSISNFLEEQKNIHGEIVLVGEAATELGVEGFRVQEGSGCDLPAPLALAVLGGGAWEAEPLDMCDLLEPLYVRPPDAKLPANSPLTPPMA